MVNNENIEDKRRSFKIKTIHYNIFFKATIIIMVNT